MYIIPYDGSLDSESYRTKDQQRGGEVIVYYDILDLEEILGPSFKTKTSLASEVDQFSVFDGRKTPSLTHYILDASHY